MKWYFCRGSMYVKGLCDVDNSDRHKNYGEKNYKCIFHANFNVLFLKIS